MQIEIEAATRHEGQGSHEEGIASAFWCGGFALAGLLYVMVRLSAGPPPVAASGVEPRRSVSRGEARASGEPSFVEERPAPSSAPAAPPSVGSFPALPPHAGLGEYTLEGARLRVVKISSAVPDQLLGRLQALIFAHLSLEGAPIPGGASPAGAIPFDLEYKLERVRVDHTTVTVQLSLVVMQGRAILFLFQKEATIEFGPGALTPAEIETAKADLLEALVPELQRDLRKALAKYKAP